jgi:hypothetical protein
MDLMPLEDTPMSYFLINSITNARTCEVGMTLAPFKGQSWNYVQQYEETFVANINQFNFPHKKK